MVGCVFNRFGGVGGPGGAAQGAGEDAGPGDHGLQGRPRPAAALGEDADRRGRQRGAGLPSGAGPRHVLAVLRGQGGQAEGGGRGQAEGAGRTNGAESARAYRGQRGREGDRYRKARGRTGSPGELRGDDYRLPRAERAGAGGHRPAQRRGEAAAKRRHRPAEDRRRAEGGRPGPRHGRDVQGRPSRQGQPGGVPQPADAEARLAPEKACKDRRRRHALSPAGRAMDTQLQGHHRWQGQRGRQAPGHADQRADRPQGRHDAPGGGRADVRFQRIGGPDLAARDDRPSVAAVSASGADRFRHVQFDHDAGADDGQAIPARG